MDKVSQVPHGVRLVAVVEASKGLLVVLAGLGLLTLIHADLQQLAEDLVAHLHLNPGSRYPRIFIELAAHVTDRRLWLLASLAFGYASLRFIEAAGLWWHRVWAEWLAALSGGIYLPFELYELAKGVTVLKVLTLTINLVVVLYMGRLLWDRYRASPLATGSGLAVIPGIGESPQSPNPGGVAPDQGNPSHRVGVGAEPAHHPDDQHITAEQG